MGGGSRRRRSVGAMLAVGLAAGGLWAVSAAPIGGAAVAAPSASPPAVPSLVTRLASRAWKTVAPPAGPRVRARLDGSRCRYSARGIPACGAYVGAAVGLNDDPAAFERRVGGRLGIHRSYWQAGQVDASVAYARADLASGRLPWISYKLPYSWAAMAAGRGDRWARGIAARLKALPGPVWVAFHHEPEKDGDIKEWTAIQRRLAPIVRSTAPNVAFTIVLTGYNQVHGDPQYHLDALWPKSTPIDLVGFDIYDMYGTVKGANLTRPANLKKEYFDELGGWADRHGVAWGLAESGRTQQSWQADPSWFDDVYDGLIADGGVAFTYFDSDQDRTGYWQLRHTSEYDAFGSVLDDSPLVAKGG